MFSSILLPDCRYPGVANLERLKSARALNGNHSGFSSNLKNDSTLSLRCPAMKESTL